jgi:hypothetical protein
MQPYKYDTASCKGKQPAVEIGIPLPPSVWFPRKAIMSRPRVSDGIFDRPGDTVSAPRTTGDTGLSVPRRHRLHRISNTWTSSDADINLIAREEEAYDPTPFLVEYNRLARRVGTPIAVSQLRADGAW